MSQTPLQPYANARLLLHVHQLPGNVESPRLGRLVAEAFLARQRPVLETNVALGVDAGDFSYQGYLCRCAVLSNTPTNPWDWLASAISWSSTGLRAPLAGGEFVQAPAVGAIWLGELASLSSASGALPAANRGQLAGLTVTEFGGLYGAGGIGALTQPLLGERLELVLKPNRVAVIQPGDTLLTIAERYGTTVDSLRTVNAELLALITINTATPKFLRLNRTPMPLALMVVPWIRSGSPQGSFTTTWVGVWPTTTNQWPEPVGRSTGPRWM